MWAHVSEPASQTHHQINWIKWRYRKEVFFLKTSRKSIPNSSWSDTDWGVAPTQRYVSLWQEEDSWEQLIWLLSPITLHLATYQNQTREKKDFMAGVCTTSAAQGQSTYRSIYIRRRTTWTMGQLVFQHRNATWNLVFTFHRQCVKPRAHMDRLHEPTASRHVLLCFMSHAYSSEVFDGQGSLITSRTTTSSGRSSSDPWPRALKE